jgi:hypothetical protein
VNVGDASKSIAAGFATRIWPVLASIKNAFDVLPAVIE